VPAGSIAGRSLTIVVAIMSFLACLTLGAVTLVRDASLDWQSDIVREITIQVRPVEGVDTDAETQKAVDIALSAQGDPADLATFKGAGNASLTGAELGEIHLFGLLSQVLSGLSLKFSSLKLDAARTSFRLEHGRLLFPDLKVTGPSAVIDARGNFAIETGGLDFSARFRPYEDNLNLITAVVGIVLNPLTSILELKLGGQLAKPEWSVLVSGSRPHPEAPAAPAPAPADPAKPVPPKG